MADHSNLPAPYQSPWRQLGQAMVAVLASLRLDLRRLWRRNRSGQLSRPGWWPQDLAALFWPLLLAGVLAVGAGGLTMMGRLQQPNPGAAPTAALPPLTAEHDQSKSVAADAGTELARPDKPRSEEGTASRPRPDETASAPAESSAVEPLPLQPETNTMAATAAAADSASELLQAMAAADSGDLIAAAETPGDGGLLLLRLSRRFEQLSAKQQSHWAEAWLQRSQELGFDQLQLRDTAGRTIGYQARVGSGMILLDAAPAP